MVNVNSSIFRDISTIFHYTGQTSLFLGLFMIIPIIVAIIYKESNLAIAFLISSVLAIAIGLIVIRFFKKHEMSLKIAMIFSTLIWGIATIIGGLPYFFSGELNFLDSLFEAISGFTTTGFSMFAHIEEAGYAINFWRGMTQWIGGLGIIFTMIVMLRSSGASILRLYRAEGREEKIFPSIKNTAKFIVFIYLILTAIGIILLLLSGIPLFDSIFYCFVSLSTGGFALSTTSILQYNNPLTELVSMIIMIAGSINFALLFLLYKKKFKEFFNDIETKVALVLIPLSIIIVTLLLIQANTYPTLFENIRFATFQVVSAISTTGLQTAFYPDILNNWHAAAFFVLIVLMIIGAGSCSTGGGIKWLRIGIIYKSIIWQIKSLLLPEKAVIRKKISHFNVLKVNNDLIRITGLFISLYLIIYVISVILILTYYFDIPRVLFEVASAMSNVGLTSGILTPTSPYYIKIIFMLDFWVGRIEIWPVLLVLFMFLKTVKRGFKKNKSYR